MPAFGEILAREQIWLVVTYLQSLDVDAGSDGVTSGEAG
jgi:mono/diheme cytochrome c family protein